VQRFSLYTNYSALIGQMIQSVVIGLQHRKQHLIHISAANEDHKLPLCKFVRLLRIILYNRKWYWNCWRLNVGSSESIILFVVHFDV